MKTKRIGLYFGTFNPIHVGHLIIANHMANHEDLDQVWLVVTPQNPLKSKSGMLSDVHRLQLVRIAIEDNPKLMASKVEFDLPKPSYTVETLAYLQEQHPDHKFMLIMGEDNLRTIHRWKNFEHILANYDLLVYPRVNQPSEMETPSLSPDQMKRVRLCPAPVMNISATFIRDAIKSGKDVRYLLTPEVEAYVREMHFFEK
jgi:nicotinate-nucleotide adenylyltransferase